MTEEIPQMKPTYGEPEREALSEYLHSGGWLTEYERTREMEARLGDILDVEHVWMTPSGTMSLTLAVMALDLPSDASVLVPDFTMIGTANAVRFSGHEPVFVDVDPDTFCLDVDSVPESAAERADALIYVSINGRSRTLPAVRDFAAEHDITVVEDAAQALGSKSRGEMLGSIGEVGCFSFSYSKIATTGQGGAVVTDDDHLSERLSELRDWGRDEYGVDEHPAFGVNAKFTDLQAVVGLAQLDRLEDRKAFRRGLFEQYRDRLAGVDAVEVPETDLSETVPWFVDALFPSEAVRDAVADRLSDRSIGTRPFYPPIHSQGPYREETTRSFPVTTDISDRGLWLPSSFELTEDEVDRVCAAIEESLADVGSTADSVRH